MRPLLSVAYMARDGEQELMYCNLARLMLQLPSALRAMTEVVVLWDAKVETVAAASLSFYSIVHAYREFPKPFDFGHRRNLLTGLCHADWILQLDADEYMSDQLARAIPDVIDSNPFIAAYSIARHNHLIGSKTKVRNYCEKQNWHYDLSHRVNYPDRQLRLYRNSPEIYFVGKVHETLCSVRELGQIPESCFIIHTKTLAAQIKANKLYASL